MALTTLEQERRWAEERIAEIRAVEAGMAEDVRAGAPGRERAARGKVVGSAAPPVDQQYREAGMGG